MLLSVRCKLDLICNKKEFCAHLQAKISESIRGGLWILKCTSALYLLCLKQVLNVNKTYEILIQWNQAVSIFPFLY